MTLLLNAGVTLKLQKCKFFLEPIHYFGHVIRPRPLEIASNTKDAIRGPRAAATLIEVRSFLALRSVFRRFVTDFARLATLLN